jgi:hypothetical protein
MMFDPTDYLEIAIELSTPSRYSDPETTLVEAYVRTSVGRAYYGLYLVVRSAIVQRHKVPVRRLRHGALYTHLQNSRLQADV